MTKPHKQANRHPKYKTAYRVKNWREYDRALRDRDATVEVRRQIDRAPQGPVSV
ncbi:MAG: hypothetical protein OEU26_18940 [Candidatus Tectomicrobia bacterium]|nr:hypothetical protein [Candidatus Tectomicrobia bacterium]